MRSLTALIHYFGVLPRSRPELIGLRVYPDHRVAIEEDLAGRMHDSRETWLQKLYRREVRSWPTGRADRPVVHDSVLRPVAADAPPPGDRTDPRWILALDPEVESWAPHDPTRWVPDAATPRAPGSPDEGW